MDYRGGAVLTPWRSPEGLHFIHPGAWIQVFLEEKKHVKVLNKVWLKPQTNALVTRTFVHRLADWAMVSGGRYSSLSLTFCTIAAARVTESHFTVCSTANMSLDCRFDAAYLNESSRVLKSQLKCFHSQLTDTAQNWRNTGNDHTIHKTMVNGLTTDTFTDSFLLTRSYIWLRSVSLLVAWGHTWTPQRWHR